MWFLAKEPLNNYILLIINTTMINYLKFTLHTCQNPITTTFIFFFQWIHKKQQTLKRFHEKLFQMSRVIANALTHIQNPKGHIVSNV
jgi:hypothetical protein